MKTWHEFFQDTGGDYSMHRLIMFGTWFVASVVMIWLTYDGKMSEGYFTMYLGIPAISLGVSKAQDTKVAMATAPAAAGAP